MSKVYVFTYGILSDSNSVGASLLEKAGAEKVSESCTANYYQLYLSAGIPAMINDNETNAGTQIKGNLFEVKPHNLPLLDRAMGAPDFFYRAKISMSEGVDAFAYFLPKRYLLPARDELIEDGNWEKTGRALLSKKLEIPQKTYTGWQSSKSPYRGHDYSYGHWNYDEDYVLNKETGAWEKKEEKKAEVEADQKLPQWAVNQIMRTGKVQSIEASEPEMENEEDEAEQLEAAFDDWVEDYVKGMAESQGFKVPCEDYCPAGRKTASACRVQHNTCGEYLKGIARNRYGLDVD